MADAPYYVMCTNKKWIYNRYAKTKVLVDCGRCPACLQKKANGIASNIRHHGKKGEICLFLTLTYKNDYIPMIDKNDNLYFQWIDGKLLPCVRLFRLHNVMRYYNRHTNQYEEKVTPYEELGYLPIHDECMFDLVKNMDSYKKYNYIPLSWFYSIPYDTVFSFVKQKLEKLPYVNGNGNFPLDYVSVCYYKDYQNFIKRLYTNLKRNYCYDTKKLSIFGCSEYGKSFSRAHFHALLWCPSTDYFIVKRAITESWLYNNRYQRFNKMVQIARAPARYVSGYVTKHIDLPFLFRERAFKQRHSTSKYFNYTNEAFKPQNVKRSALAHSLEYDSYIIRKGGTVEPVTLLLPRYVINRFFPKCSGFSRFTYDSLEKYIYKPYSLYRELKNNPKYRERFLDYFYSSKDIVRSIRIFFIKFYGYIRKLRSIANLFGMSYRDYLILHRETWTTFLSKKQKKLHDEVNTIEDYFCGFYDNIKDWYDCDLVNIFLSENYQLINPFNLVIDPNEFPRNLLEHYNLIKQRHELNIQYGVSDSCLEKETLI